MSKSDYGKSPKAGWTAKFEEGWKRAMGKDEVCKHCGKLKKHGFVCKNCGKGD